MPQEELDDLSPWPQRISKAVCHVLNDAEQFSRKGRLRPKYLGEDKEELPPKDALREESEGEPNCGGEDHHGLHRHHPLHPIILVGTDMVTDVEVMWSMATPFFFQVDPCLEERYKETSNHDLIRVHCLLGSLIIFIVALVTMFKKPGPIPFLMRSVRATASMGSRDTWDENMHQEKKNYPW